MRSRMASACSPASAIRPPLQKSMRALVLAGVALLADGDQVVALHHQPAVAVRIGGLEAEHGHRRALGQRRRAGRAACRLSPAACRRTSPARRPRLLASACRAASTACAVPRRSRCSKICACGAIACAALVTAAWPGPTTTAISPPPASTAAVRTCASRLRPPIACSTFGSVERMRVPSPAASTMAKQVRRSMRISAHAERENARMPIAYRRQ